MEKNIENIGKLCQKCYSCQVKYSCEKCYACESCYGAQGEMKCASCYTCEKCYNAEAFGVRQQEEKKAGIGKATEPQQCQISPIPAKFSELTLWNTAMCDYRCRYCFVYKLYPNQPNKEISDEVIAKLPEFVKKYFVPNPSIWFFGGEPFVSYQTIQKVYHVIKREIPTARFGATSNLSLITEERAKWLGRNGFQILCSIDGGKESHDKYRVRADGSPTWEESWKGLMNVKKYINPNPQIRWTVSPDTTENLYNDVVMYVEHGFTNLAIDPVYEVEWKPEQIEVYISELKKIGNFILDVTYPILLKPFQDLYIVGEQPVNWRSRCGLAQGGIGMDVLGRAFACHRFVASNKEENILGDVNGIDEQKRKEWNERYWKAGKPVSVDGEERCNKCSFFNWCMGGCLAVNYDVCGSSNVVPKTYCDIEERKATELLSLAMRMKVRYGQTFRPRY